VAEVHDLAPTRPIETTLGTLIAVVPSSLRAGLHRYDDVRVAWSWIRTSTAAPPALV
jgi:hypothetical protein